MTEHLPGMEPENIPAITKAAEEYDKVKNQRLGLLREEVVLKDVLIALMKDRRLTTYRDGELTVEIENKDSIKVKIEDDA